MAGKKVMLGRKKKLAKAERLEPVASVTLGDPRRFWEVAHMVGGFWLGELEHACQSPLVLRAVLHAMDRAVVRMHPETRKQFDKAAIELRRLEVLGVELSIERAPE